MEGCASLHSRSGVGFAGHRGGKVRLRFFDAQFVLLHPPEPICLGLRIRLAARPLQIGQAAQHRVAFALGRRGFLLQRKGASVIGLGIRDLADGGAGRYRTAGNAHGGRDEPVHGSADHDNPAIDHRFPARPDKHILVGRYRADGDKQGTDAVFRGPPPRQGWFCLGGDLGRTPSFRERPEKSGALMRDVGHEFRSSSECHSI